MSVAPTAAAPGLTWPGATGYFTVPQLQALGVNVGALNTPLGQAQKTAPGNFWARVAADIPGNLQRAYFGPVSNGQIFTSGQLGGATNQAAFQKVLATLAAAGHPWSSTAPNPFGASALGAPALISDAGGGGAAPPDLSFLNQLNFASPAAAAPAPTASTPAATPEQTTAFSYGAGAPDNRGSSLGAQGLPNASLLLAQALRKKKLLA